MKRAMFTIFAAFALVLAMPAVAQEELDESRTNPDARSIAPGSGLTITGTVVEWDEKQLVIQTTTGTQHIQLTPNTEKPVELDAGENVSVDYTRTSQGIMIAQKVRTGGEMADTKVETTTDLTADTDADLEAEMDTESDLEANAGLQADVQTEDEWQTETDVSTDLDTDVETTTADTELDDRYGDETDTYQAQSDLPATGSELPLFALLGLLSVAAAIGVRSFVR